MRKREKRINAEKEKRERGSLKGWERKCENDKYRGKECGRKIEGD